MLYIYYVYDVKGLGVKGYLLRLLDGCELLVAVQAPGEGGGGCLNSLKTLPPPPPHQKKINAYKQTIPKRSVLISKPSAYNQTLARQKKKESEEIKYDSQPRPSKLSIVQLLNFIHPT